MLTEHVIRAQKYLSTGNWSSSGSVDRHDEGFSQRTTSAVQAGWKPAKHILILTNLISLNSWSRIKREGERKSAIFFSSETKNFPSESAQMEIPLRHVLKY
jgi:hypothetical protein